MQLERRFSKLEAVDGKLVGYAAVFNSPSADLGGFVEVVTPQAFNRTLRENPDIFALVDHDDAKVLGRTTAGTLNLSIDEVGLRVEISPPDTTYARDIMESVRRGDIDGMSFAFRARKQRFDRTGTTPVRHLLDVDMKEVSIVTFPAYPDTSVALRELNTDPNQIKRLRLRLVS